MIEIIDHIEIDPNILNGKPCIKGTRIPVSTILANLEEGISIKELIDEFEPLTEEDVRAAIKYARLSMLEELPVGSFA
jgi:uncharacterized protein (DUF433 family)